MGVNSMPAKGSFERQYEPITARQGRSHGFSSIFSFAESQSRVGKHGRTSLRLARMPDALGSLLRSPAPNGLHLEEGKAKIIRLGLGNPNRRKDGQATWRMKSKTEEKEKAFLNGWIFFFFLSFLLKSLYYGIGFYEIADDACHTHER